MTSLCQIFWNISGPQSPPQSELRSDWTSIGRQLYIPPFSASRRREVVQGIGYRPPSVARTLTRRYIGAERIGHSVRYNFTLSRRRPWAAWKLRQMRRPVWLLLAAAGIAAATRPVAALGPACPNAGEVSRFPKPANVPAGQFCRPFPFPSVISIVPGPGAAADSACAATLPLPHR